jgi:hypothetical protein
VKRTSAGPFDDTFPRPKSSHFRRCRLTGYDPRSRYDAKSVAPLGKCRALVSGNMIGFVAFDLILRRVGARVVNVALIVEVMRVDPNDRTADAPGLRVPTDSISNFVPFSHWVFLVVQASSELRLAFGITAKADLIERLVVLSALH